MIDDDILKVPVPDHEILSMLDRSSRIIMLPGTFDVANSKVLGFMVIDKEGEDPFLAFLNKSYWEKHQTKKIKDKITLASDLTTNERDQNGEN